MGQGVGQGVGQGKDDERGRTELSLLLYSLRHVCACACVLLRHSKDFARACQKSRAIILLVEA